MDRNANGMIAVWLHVAESREEEFNAWYETEHVAEVCAIDGVVSGRRYFSASRLPKYLVFYETRDEQVEPGPGFQRLLSHQTPWSCRMQEFYGENRVRRNYRRLFAQGAFPATHEGSLFTLTAEASGNIDAARVTAGAADALNVPGCVAVRCFENVATDARYLEVYDFTTADGPAQPAWNDFIESRKAALRSAGLSNIVSDSYRATGTPQVVS